MVLHDDRGVRTKADEDEFDWGANRKPPEGPEHAEDFDDVDDDAVSLGDEPNAARAASSDGGVPSDLSIFDSLLPAREGDEEVETASPPPAKPKVQVPAPASLQGSPPRPPSSPMPRPPASLAPPLPPPPPVGAAPPPPPPP